MSEAIAEPLAGALSAAANQDGDKAARPVPRHIALRGERWQGTLADAQKFIDQLEKLQEDDRGKRWAKRAAWRGCKPICTARGATAKSIF